MAAFERDYPFVVKGNARFLDQEFPSEVRLFFLSSVSLVAFASTVSPVSPAAAVQLYL